LTTTEQIHEDAIWDIATWMESNMLSRRACDKSVDKLSGLADAVLVENKDNARLQELLMVFGGNPDDRKEAVCRALKRVATAYARMSSRHSRGWVNAYRATLRTEQEKRDAVRRKEDRPRQVTSGRMLAVMA
jgi:hypothetical protein